MKRISDLDEAILEAIARFGYMRINQVHAWTGANGRGVSDRLRWMRQSRYVDYRQVSGHLRTDDGRVINAGVRMWYLTPNGATRIAELGDLVVAGSGRTMTVTAPNQADWRELALHDWSQHLVVTDVLVNHHLHGYTVVTPHEVKASETVDDLYYGHAVVSYQERKGRLVVDGDSGYAIRDGLAHRVRVILGKPASVPSYQATMAADQESGVPTAWYVEQADAAQALCTASTARERAGLVANDPLSFTYQLTKQSWKLFTNEHASVQPLMRPLAFIGDIGKTRAVDYMLGSPLPPRGAPAAWVDARTYWKPGVAQLAAGRTNALEAAGAAAELALVNTALCAKQSRRPVDDQAAR